MELLIGLLSIAIAIFFGLITVAFGLRGGLRKLEEVLGRIERNTSKVVERVDDIQDRLEYIDREVTRRIIDILEK